MQFELLRKPICTISFSSNISPIFFRYMQTMANIQQALDSLGGGQSRNNPISRPNNFDDSLPDIEAAVEGAAYSHMRYQRRLQVPGVFVTEGHNSRVL